MNAAAHEDATPTIHEVADALWRSGNIKEYYALRGYIMQTEELRRRLQALDLGHRNPEQGEAQ